MFKIRLFSVLLIIMIMTIPVFGKTISFKDRYQDSIGMWHEYDSLNLNQYPMYDIVETANNYTISRFGTSVALPKRSWIYYNFYLDRIVPIVTIQNYSQINQLVTKVNSSAWYLTVPWSASQVKSVTDDLIDMGVFKRSTSISVTDSNGSSYNVLPKVVGGNIRLYFNPQTYSGVVYPLTLTENTITVSNATTGWCNGNASISLNGTRCTGDGTIALNLRNDSQLNMSGLVAYWSADSTIGTTWRNVNNESGLINTTNQGTWNGNTTLNYTTGRIGNAGSFDGVDDYVDAGNDASLNITSAITFEAWVKPINLSVTFQGIIAKGAGGLNGYRFAIGTSQKPYIEINDNGIYSDVVLSNNKWYHIVSTADGTNLIIYVNGVGTSTASTALPASTASTIMIGKLGKYFNGSIDEVRIYNRALSASEIAVMYNTSLRTHGGISITNQTATAGQVHSTVSIAYTGGDSTHNFSIYANKTGIEGRTLVTANAVSGTTYSIPAAIQNQTMDYYVEFNGNGSNTSFLTSLSWSEPEPVTLSGYVTDGVNVISGANVSTSIGFNLTNATGYYYIVNHINGTIYKITTTKTLFSENITSVTMSGNTTQNITLYPSASASETQIRISQVKNLTEILDFNSALARVYSYRIWNQTNGNCYKIKVSETGTLFTISC